jgi:ElaB/YqjD/DUF883 family membrane-anchored ribosome-binding protein
LTAQAETPDVGARGDRLGQAVSSAKSAISEAGEGAADAIKNALVSADDYVRENPWIAVGVVAGIAGAVGFLAGLVAAPKKRYFWN